MLAIPAAALLLALPVAPQEEQAEPAFVPARVGGDTVAVRSFFDKTSPVIAQLTTGTPVKIVVRNPPWSRVQVPGGLVVWVYGEYVDVEGTRGTLNAKHVRARPLPSTDANSFPLGQFLEGDEVTVLGEDGDWLQVRSPETLAGWVLSDGLTGIASADAEFEKDWATLAAAVAQADGTPDGIEPEAAVAAGAGGVAAEAGAAAGAAPVEAGAAPTEFEPVLIEELPAPDWEDSEAAAGAAAAEKPSVTDAGTGAPATERSAAELLAGGEEQALLAAEVDLVKLANDPWSEPRAMRIQEVFDAVVWNSDDVVRVDRARVGIARLDTLRRAAELDAAIAARQEELAAEADRADAAAAAIAAEERGVEEGPLASYTLVGWVEYKPKVYSAVPYVITSGTRSHAVLSVDGRYDMRDFLGREVAVRGKWRRGSVQGVRVLEFEALRVLPPRPVEPVPEDE